MKRLVICLDVGNTHIYGGVFQNKTLLLSFRYPSTWQLTADVFGLFLKDVLDKNHLNSNQVDSIVICSVVPSLDYSICSACRKYFAIDPLRVQPGVKTGIKLNIKNPLELGADRIANAVGGVDYFPDKHLIIVDFGTATTICAISKDKEYLGGALFPGLKLSMDALSQGAAKLLTVDLVVPESVLGKSTATHLQSGIFYGQLGAVKEITGRITQSVFSEEMPCLIATGGFLNLFNRTFKHLFSACMPDLVLYGLRIIGEKNDS